MRQVIALAFLVLFSLITSASADPARRIEELLAHQSFDQRGHVSTMTSANVNGCVVRLTQHTVNACSKALHFQSHQRLIDLRVLKSDQDDVSQEPTSKELSNLPGTSLIYQYRWIYKRLLQNAIELETQILNEEHNRNPDDTYLLLRAVGARVMTEINPSLFAQSQLISTWCSGEQRIVPLNPHSFDFYVDPENAKEFVDLIASYAVTCAAPLSG